MNGAPSIVHEIYVKKKSAGWQLHAAYTLREAKKSLVDAAELFSSGRFEAVRVVKETYDAAHNIAHEEEVYHSPDRAESKLSRPTMARPAPSMPRNPPARTSAQATARPKPGPRRKPDAKGGAGKVAVVGFVSLGGAALIIYALLALFRRLSGMTISLDDAGSQSVIVSVFMIGFVSIFILLMKCFGLSLREILSAAPSDDVGTTPKASSTLTAIRNVSAAPPDHPIGAMGPPEGIKEDFGGQTEGQAQAQTQAQNQAQGQTQAQVHASLG
ncbi:MAG: hypothetical protein QF738_10720, partial [Rhodospirillales bacterium]|nr:hypothetical protein [Rhodospirillales bacterium]